MLRFARATLLALTATFAVTACAPVAKNSALSIAQERRASANVVRQLETKGKLIRDRRLQSYLDGVVGRVAAQRPPGSIPVRAYIVKDAEAGYLELLPSAIEKVLDQRCAVREKQWAERTLRESEEKYRTILENITEGYFENDLYGNLTFFNDSLPNVYGYTTDELLHMNYRKYMDEENAQKVYEA